MTACIGRNHDVFAWSTHQLLEISPSIAQHELHIRSDSQPVKQRKRDFSAEQNLIIRPTASSNWERHHHRTLHHPLLISRGFFATTSFLPPLHFGFEELSFITIQQPLSSSDLKRRVHPSFNNPFIFRFEEKVSFSIDEQPSTSSTAFADRLAIREAPSSSPLSTTDSKRIWLSLAHYCSWNWRPSDLSKAAQGLFFLGATYRSSTIIPRGETTCYVELHPKLMGVTGKYFDEELSRRLWDLSEKMVKVNE
ncbi:uncharacterized protein LOC122039544 [Zingiber officinale]|uniref:uncharacterized protein LOC122039544 n=1 Tax=Zingiber officinale TaxID=94328 RepID=UPI001C4C9BE9|nr:uncharacterized protein LOC122039544 [Zingiber officinale]